MRHATPNSLILFDELGRGTATYDGMALAQSIIEYIHEHVRAKTLFSTHYHELTVLDQELLRLRNVHVGAVEKDGEVVFLHKMMEGPADKSYGIHVAKIAGLPAPLLERAATILATLEADATSMAPAVAIETEQPASHPITSAPQVSEEDPLQMSLFGEITPAEQSVLDQLRKLDLLDVTPRKAWEILSDLQNGL